jgi:aspartyl protease family protein
MSRLPPRYDPDLPDPDFEPQGSGKAVRWALFWVLLICGVTAGSGIVARVGLMVFSTSLSKPVTVSIPAAPQSDAHAKTAAHAKPQAAVANSQSYRADASGHFYIDALVNGAPIRFLVDTGATVVALTPDDARAAGVLNGMLSYTTPVQTADGTTHAAPVTLREIVMGQMSQEEVPAIVLEKPGAISLLGMSFLKRLNYEVRGQQLILYW